LTATKANPPSDHHFIPRFFLKQWVGTDDELIEYTIKNGKLIDKLVGVGGTGYEKDLYKFPELPPESQQYLEQEFFQYLDDTAARALQIHLSGNDEWTNELVNAWSRFTLGVHLRHPDAMPELRAAAKMLWEKGGPASQEEYEKIRTPEDPLTFDEYITNHDPLVKIKIQVNMIIKAFDNETVITHLNKMQKYTIDVASSRYRLLLSDRPICFSNFLKANGLAFLPISPTKLFIAANQYDGLAKVRAMPVNDLVKNINVFVAQRARRFIWSPNRAQQRFVERYMSTQCETRPFFKSLDNPETLPAVQ
jgi:hypothetical protein